MVKKIINIFKRNFFIDHYTKLFARFLKSKWNYSTKKSDGIVLVEFYPVNLTLICFSYFINVLAIEKNLKIKSFALERSNYFIYRLKFRKLFYLYKKMNASNHFHYRYKNLKKYNKVIEIELNDILTKIKTKEDLVNFEYKGLKIGVDIYEYYLYKCKRPTLDLNDPKFKILFKDILNLIYFWKIYFENNKIKYLVLSHALYDYSILYKLATQYGIKTYLPSIRTLVKLENQNNFLCPEFEKFPKIFSYLSDEVKTYGIELAKDKLNERLSGKIGVNIPYAKLSAYSANSSQAKVLKTSNKLKVLIATHCFFDNPWAYGRNIFVDFYDWIHFLGNLSNELDYDWYLKTHPDVFPENDIILDEILKIYPNIQKVPAKTSHHQLISEGISWVLTVYGTIGHEYPLLGANVLNAGLKNPHVAYDFNWHAKDKEQYDYYIRNLQNLKKQINLNEIFEFYYLNYYCIYNDSLILNSYYETASKINLDKYWNTDIFNFFLNDINEEKHLEIIENMKVFIKSNKFWYIEKLKNADII